GGGSVSLPAGTIYSAGAGLSLTGSTFSALDASPTNEIQTLSLSGSNLSLSNGGGSVSLPAGTTYSAGSGLALTGTTFSALDVSPSNEIQTLSLSGNTLSLTNGGSVALPTGTPSQWTTAGANIHYTAGNVGIGDATPAATLTVGNGDKFQVVGADGDVLFTDPQASIRFPAVTSASAPMIQMFSTGTQNADRMVVAHSPSFPTWGLQYRDTTDVMFIRNNNIRHVAFELNTGHVGIGIEDPAFPLDILGRMRLRSTGSISNSPGIWFSSLNNNFDRAFIGMAEPDSIIGIYSQHMGKWAIEFEVMREPRIGINIAAGSPPRAELHVRHTNFGGSNDGIRIQNEGSNNHYWNLYTSNTTGQFEFFYRGIKRATIDDVTGAYTAISDARLKGDVRPLGEVMSRVLQLKPSQYHYLSDSTQRRYTGVIAQELETLFPEFVYYGGDDQVLYTVDYAGLSVIALKGIQEQQTQIQQLQAELDAQKQRNDELESRLLLLEKLMRADPVD
ncbi:MAG: tail fiber domain-containing protein, partial [Bacteroidia bacterium]|nr:tail fiber domain-containing protein [Bacteroidia bacterium]